MEVPVSAVFTGSVVKYAHSAQYFGHAGNKIRLVKVITQVRVSAEFLTFREYN